MSDLTNTEKFKLENLFGMSSGYVIDFSNRTFQEFVLGSVDLDIYNDKYDYSSGSKANRLRAFWTKESNYLVSKLLSDLLSYWQTRVEMGFQIAEVDQELFAECAKISERLKNESVVENIEVIQPPFDDRDFSLLAKSIRENIQKNEPEIAIDRLHTYMVKYVRFLCDKHSIPYDTKVPLNSLFGGYVKYLRDAGKIESQMTVKILGASTKILSAYNDVRNNQSFAHDNPILNYHESILIFSNVTSLVRFIESIEGTNSEVQEENNSNTEWDDISF